MDNTPIEVEQYIRREVERQHDKPGYVGMVLAWQYAMGNRHDLPDENDACILAYYIKDHEQANVITGSNNYRHTNVAVDGGMRVIGSKPADIPRQMHLLFEVLTEDHGNRMLDWSVNDFTKQLLEIHPWVDGNGRTASIIRNWLLGTLETPSDLPYYFGEAPQEGETDESDRG